MIQSSSVADVAAEVRSAPVQVEHQIDHALTRPVIGELAAAAGAEDRKAVGGDQIAFFCARAGGVERRVLDQPDLFRRLACGNCRGARLHRSDGIGVGEEVLHG